MGRHSQFRMPVDTLMRRRVSPRRCWIGWWRSVLSEKRMACTTVLEDGPSISLPSDIAIRPFMTEPLVLHSTMCVAAHAMVDPRPPSPVLATRLHECEREDALLCGREAALVGGRSAAAIHAPAAAAGIRMVPREPPAPRSRTTTSLSGGVTCSCAGVAREGACHVVRRVRIMEFSWTSYIPAPLTRHPTASILQCRNQWVGDSVESVGVTPT